MIINSASWTGRDGVQADVTAVTLSRQAAWLVRESIVDKPLRSMPAAFITGDVVLTAAAGMADNNWQLVGNALATLGGIVIAWGGDGGNPATRSDAERNRAAKCESFYLNSVALQGIGFMGSGLFAHSGVIYPEILTGILCTGGALLAKYSPAPLTPSTVLQASKALLKKQFAEAVMLVNDLPPYRKAAIVWLASQVPLAAVATQIAMNDQPATATGYFIAIGLYALGNIQAFRSWRAEPVKPPAMPATTFPAQSL